MKRNILNKLFFVLFAATIALTGCKEDDETPAPTVKINTNSLGSDQTKGNAATGQTITINLTANAAEGIKSITATKAVGGTSSTLPGYPVTTGFDSKTAHTWNATYTVVETSGDVTLNFRVSDDKGKESSVSFKITVSSDYSFFNAVLLAAPLGNFTSKTFFSSSNGSTYTVDEARPSSNLIDFGYFFGATASASLAAPNDYLSTAYDLTGWATRNSTQFKTTSGVDFDALTTSAQISSAYDAGTLSTNGTNPGGSATRIYNLAANQVIGFETSAGKKGIIKITSVTPGATETGRIALSVKVQK
jgi:hypothetical protein